MTGAGYRLLQIATRASPAVACQLVLLFADGPHRLPALQAAAALSPVVLGLVVAPRVSRPAPALAWAGGAAGLLGLWLCQWAANAAQGAAAGCLLAIGIATTVAGERLSRLVLPSLLATGVLLACAALWGSPAAAAAGGLLLSGGTLAAVWPPLARRGVSGRSARAVAGIALLAVGVTAFVGATSERAWWFGDVTWHGPRETAAVALTFDDGVNPPATLAIADALRAAGAHGTFFIVAHTLEERPDVARSLLADGDVVGNHSYSHPRWGILDLRYAEAARAEATFRAQLGICPALFRPPFGLHSPWMARAAAESGLRIITWDVQVEDWQTADPATIAARVLARVHRGSIVLLHDGADGRIGADRSALVQAMPAILEGLRARGLRAVSVPELLGTPAYRAQC